MFVKEFFKEIVFTEASFNILTFWFFDFLLLIIIFDDINIFWFIPGSLIFVYFLAYLWFLSYRLEMKKKLNKNKIEK